MAGTKAEHLGWCKQRALGCVERGDLIGAYASMMSDLSKHPETANHSAIALAGDLMDNGHLGTADKMRDFIEGFN